MDILIAVVIILATLVIIWYLNKEEFNDRETWPNYEPSVDMLEFRADDSKKAKFDDVEIVKSKKIKDSTSPKFCYHLITQKSELNVLYIQCVRFCIASGVLRA